MHIHSALQDKVEQSEDRLGLMVAGKKQSEARACLRWHERQVFCWNDLVCVNVLHLKGKIYKSTGTSQVRSYSPLLYQRE